MKNLKSLAIFTILIFALGSFVNAQGLKYVKIKTSAVSELCKETIENSLAYEKGVKDVDLDLESKIVTVKYSDKKTTDEDIRNAIAKLGYDADDKKADSKAYSDLPNECKKISKNDCSNKSKTNSAKSDCSSKCSGHK